jgi:hypothetical protein
VDFSRTAESAVDAKTFAALPVWHLAVSGQVFKTLRAPAVKKYQFFLTA